MVTPALIHDPLVQRLAAELSAAQRADAEAWHLRYAWQAIAYQRMVAYTARYGLPGGDAESAAIADRMLHARCFLWPEEETQLALSAPLPPHQVGLPEESEPPAVWVMQTDMRDDQYSVGLVYVEATADKLVGVAFANLKGTEENRLMPLNVPWGTQWPSDVAEDMRYTTEWLLRLWWFVHSPRVGTVAGEDPRAERRRLTRQGIDTGKLAVSVVHYSGAREERSSGDTGGGVRRHWVAGHYRAQWYPSIEAHRVIWIEPFLRGDGGIDASEPPSSRTVRRL